MSDDDPGKVRSHLLNFARKHDTPATPAPSAVPLTTVGFIRRGRFVGGPLDAFWRAHAWSPDGAHLAFGGRNASGAKGVLHVWNGTTGQRPNKSMGRLIGRLANRQVISLSWSPDSQYLASAKVTFPANERSVHVHGPAGDPRPIPLPPGIAVSLVDWSPDGSLLALSSRVDPRIALVDPASGAVRRVLDNLIGPVAWQREGRLIACVRAASVLLVDPVTGEPAFRLAEKTTHRATTLAWSRDGRRLAVADGTETVVYTQNDDSSWRFNRLSWTTAEGDRGPDGAVGALQWLDGGNYLLEFRPKGGAWRDEQATTVATITLVDVETGQRLLIQRLMEINQTGVKGAAGIAAAPDGRRIAIVDDNLPPVIYEVTGDLPNFVP
jgi:dipeptidyl aminopeptidase/acylaminoacyl peptidase